MKSIDKYENIQKELPHLQKVLLDAIQSEFLEIRHVKHTCDKYSKACVQIPELNQATFVVYSRYIKKSNHEYEKFVFLDDVGHSVATVSGKEMELYGLLDPCMNLELSPEYEEALHEQEQHVETPVNTNDREHYFKK